MLVTEIGGWVDRFDRTGRLVYSIRTPTDCPSDAQPLPDADVLIAGFNTPGRIDILTPRGTIVWTYGRSTATWANREAPQPTSTSPTRSISSGSQAGALDAERTHSMLFGPAYPALSQA